MSKILFAQGLIKFRSFLKVVRLSKFLMLNSMFFHSDILVGIMSFQNDHVLLSKEGCYS